MSASAADALLRSHVASLTRPAVAVPTQLISQRAAPPLSRQSAEVSFHCSCQPSNLSWVEFTGTVVQLSLFLCCVWKAKNLQESFKCLAFCRSKIFCLFVHCDYHQASPRCASGSCQSCCLTHEQREAALAEAFANENSSSSIF